MLAHERQPNPPTDGRSFPRTVCKHVLPFIHNGVDFFEPIQVKSLRRALKRCCCLFNCLSSRSVKNEVAQPLDNESCLTALTRLIARSCYASTIIISDNKTRFVRAANELKAFLNEWDKAKIGIDLAKIVWNYNPQGDQHFGESGKDRFKNARKSGLQSWTTQI